jgi:hypothetical protein
VKIILSKGKWLKASEIAPPLITVTSSCGKASESAFSRLVQSAPRHLKF